MLLKLEYSKFRNFLGFGNNLTTFPFKNGLNLIQGKNGQGKTTQIEIICFNWFGKAYRNVRIDELVNNRNNKNCYTETFVVKGDHTLLIKRGLKPSLLEVWEDGQKWDDLSNKNLMQERINDFLGITYTFFKQIIALIDTAYLSLPKKDKEELLESIFNLKVFSKMVDSAKKELNVKKQSFDINEVDKKGLRTTIKANEESIENIRKIKENFAAEKIETISKIGEEIRAKKNFLSQHKINLSNLIQKLLPYEKENIHKEKISLLQGNLSSLSFNIKNLKNKKTDLEQNKFDKSELPEEYLSFDEELEKIKEEHTVLNNSTTNPYLERNKETIDKFTSEIARYDEQCVSLEKDIIRWKEVLKDVSKFPYQDFKDIASDNEKMTALRISLKNKKEQYETLKKQKTGKCSICFQEITSEHLEAEKNIIESSIKTEDGQYDTLRIKLQTLIKDTIEAKLNTFTSELKTITDNRKISQFSKNGLLQNLEEEWKKDKEDKLSNLQKKRDSVQENKNRIESEFIQKSILNTEVMFERLNEEFIQKNKEFASLEKLYEEWNNTKNEIEKDKSVLEEKITTFEKNIKELEISLESAKNKTFDFSQLESTINKNIELNVRLQTLIDKNNELNNQIRVNEAIKKVFDANGIKAHFFSRIIPKLNELINSYLDDFQLPILFNFDQNFQETITDAYRNDRSYHSFSTGERNRIDFSLLFSFIELNRIIANFNLDVFFADEILDRGGDEEFLSLVIESIKKISEKQNMKTYIISHRNIGSDPNIDEIITVEKDESGFSKIRFS